MDEEFAEVVLKASALVSTVATLWKLSHTSIEKLLNIHSYKNCPYSRLPAALRMAPLRSAPTTPPSILETILYDGAAGGYFLLDQHMARMERAAQQFCYPFRMASLRAQLSEAARAWLTDARMRVRVCLLADGSARIESASLVDLPQPYVLQLSAQPVDSDDVFLRFKTTHRDCYERALASRTNLRAHDVVMYVHRIF